MRFLIDRSDLPYDAFVPDRSWLGPIEEGDDDGDAKTEELQTDAVHGEDLPLSGGPAGFDCFFHW